MTELAGNEHRADHSFFLGKNVHVTDTGFTVPKITGERAVWNEDLPNEIAHGFLPVAEAGVNGLRTALQAVTPERLGWLAELERRTVPFVFNEVDGDYIRNVLGQYFPDDPHDPRRILLRTSAVCLNAAMVGTSLAERGSRRKTKGTSDGENFKAITYTLPVVEEDDKDFVASVFQIGAATTIGVQYARYTKGEDVFAYPTKSTVSLIVTSPETSVDATLTVPVLMSPRQVSVDFGRKDPKTRITDPVARFNLLATFAKSVSQQFAPRRRI